MGGLIWIFVGVVWWWRFTQPPADTVLDILLGAFLVYAWYSAGKAAPLRSPWELGAGVALLINAAEELSGRPAAGLNLVGTPQILLAVTGLVYLLDKRAPGGSRRLLAGVALLVGGVLWNVGHAAHWQPAAGATSFAWILGLAGLVVLFMWWSHRQEAPASPWQFGVGLGMLAAGLGFYATGLTTGLLPLMLIGTGLGDLVARQTQPRPRGLTL